MLNKCQLFKPHGRHWWPCGWIFKFCQFWRKKKEIDPFDVISENSSPKGLFWPNEKKSVISLLSADSRYFRTYALKHLSKSVSLLIIWLAPRAGKMNQSAGYDWLPERARWSHLARPRLHAVSCKQSFTKSHIINPLLTKFVRSRWLDIGLVLFFRVYGPRLRLGPQIRKKRTWPISSHLDLTLSQ